MVLLEQEERARGFCDDIWVRRALHCIHEMNEKILTYVRGGGQVDSALVSAACDPLESPEIEFDYWLFNEE